MQFSKTLLTTLVLGLSALGNAKIFEATGYGDTAEMAKKDAVANAIKFSVGEFVVNKEELSNDDFNQKVVGYSNAYVKQIKVLSQNKVSDEYQVNVAVDIESQKLIDALKEMKVATISNAVDNNTLMAAIEHFEQKEANENTARSFEDLIDELLVLPAKEHKELVEISIIGKLKALNPNEQKKRSALSSSNYSDEYFPLQLAVKLTPAKGYMAAFKRVLAESKSNGKSGTPIYERNLSENKRAVLSSPHNYKPYYITRDKAGIIAEKLSGIYQEYKVLNLQLLDSDGEDFKEIKYCTYDHDCNNSRVQFLDSDDVIFSGVQGFAGALLPTVALNQGFFSKGSAKVRLQLYLTKDEISNLKDLKLYFSSY